MSAELVVFCGLPGVGKSTLSRRTVVVAAVAADQLRAGRPVVVDAVNASATARATWEQLTVAPRHVEVVCRDRDEHRRRVETRTADMPGHVVPTWDEVAALRFEPLAATALTIDNVGDPDALVDRIVRWLGGS